MIGAARDSRGYHCLGVYFPLLVNLLKNMVGAGMLSLPLGIDVIYRSLNGSPDAAFNAVCIFSIVLASCAALNAVTFVMIAWCCSYTHKTTTVLSQPVVQTAADGLSISYQDLCTRASGSHDEQGSSGSTNGKWLPIIVDVVIFLNCLIACIALLILIGDFLAPIVTIVIEHLRLAGDSGIVHIQHGVIISAVALGVLAPTCCLEKLESLKFTSILGLAAIAYTTLYVLVDTAVSSSSAYSEDSPQQPPSSRRFSYEDIHSIVPSLEGAMIKAWCLCSTCFLCHYNAPKYFSETVLQDGRPFRPVFIRTVVTAFVLASIVYGLFGIAGFLRFYNQSGAAIIVPILGNILNNYALSPEGEYVSVSVMFLTMAISVTFTYPFLFSALVDSIRNHLPIGRSKRYMVRIICVLTFIPLTVIAACHISDVSRPNEIKGATSCFLIASLIPLGIYIRLYKQLEASQQQQPLLQASNGNQMGDPFLPYSVLSVFIEPPVIRPLRAVVALLCVACVIGITAIVQVIIL